MPQGARIKGQEIEVRIFVDNVLKANITAIRSFEFTDMNDILREGYLGETSQRRDEINNGVVGKITMHLEGDDMFLFANVVQARATRRTPGTKIDIKATYRFTNGRRRTVIFNDTFYGNIPFTAGSRQDYVESTLDFECQDRTIV